MNRDAILATVIGFGIGLLITGIFLLGPNIKTLLPKGIKLPAVPFLASQEKKGSPTGPTPTPMALAITIDSPLPDAIVDSDALLVSGVTSPDATVVLQLNDQDVVVAAAIDGKYAGKVTVSEGENTLTATSYTKEGKMTSQTTTIFYTPEEL